MIRLVCPAGQPRILGPGRGRRFFRHESPPCEGFDNFRGAIQRSLVRTSRCRPTRQRGAPVSLLRDRLPWQGPPRSARSRGTRRLTLPAASYSRSRFGDWKASGRRGSKEDSDRRPSTDRRRHLDASVMCGDDAGDDRQPEATAESAPYRTAPPEPLERPRSVVRIHTGPVVLDLNHALARVAFHSKPDTRAGGSVNVRVREKIADNLTQSNSVATRRHGVVDIGDGEV